MSATDLDPYSFADSCAEAELVLAYATECGLEIAPADITAILKVSRVVGAAPEAPVLVEDETAFWTAFAHLTKAVSPATVRSLKAANQQISVRRLGYFGPERSVPVARNAVSRYRWLALLAVVLLLSTQIYAAVGSTIMGTTDVLKAREKEIPVEKAKRQGALPTGASAATDPDLLRLNAEEMTISEDLGASYKLLSGWNSVWHGPYSIPAYFGSFLPNTSDRSGGSTVVAAEALSTPDGEESARVTLLRGRFALQAIQNFILPLLFGWLGACAYILRRLSNEIASVTYSSLSDSGYGLRMPLGALAGMAISLFIVAPPVAALPSTAPTAVAPVFSSLTMPALAFLAGYSVELLFAVMDALIGAFTGPAKKA